jgi:hypothetical protein
MEYANAAITIGGKIKGSEVEKLAQAIADDGATVDWGDPLDEDDAIGEIGKCSVHKRHLSLCRNDQPWGRFEAVEGLCVELGLTIVAECEAGGEWHPMLLFWEPSMGTKKGPDGADEWTPRQWPITEIGRGPLLDATDIQRHLDAGTLADEIALMTVVHKFPWSLEIVDDEPNFAEVTRAVVEGAPAQQGACILTAENMRTADDCTMHDHELPAPVDPAAGDRGHWVTDTSPAIDEHGFYKSTLQEFEASAQPRTVYVVIRKESDGPSLFIDAYATRKLAEQAIADDLPEWPGFTKGDYEIEDLNLVEDHH